MNLETIFNKQVNRRLFLKISASTVATALLPACTAEYVSERKEIDGKIAKLILPNGEKDPKVGNSSVYLPPNYLSKNPVSRAVISDNQTYFIALGIEADIIINIVNLLGIINIRNLGNINWEAISPIGDLGREHVYRIEWDKKGVQEISWDGNILNQIPISSLQIV